MFTLPKLPYAYDALKPVISKKIMELHHTKHHQTYVNNLNDAVKGTDFEKMAIEELLKNIKDVPEAIRTKVQNNGGGHVNHSLFWEIMRTPNMDNKPTPAVDAALTKAFGSFDKFMNEMIDLGKTRFGSGWVWLVKGGDSELVIYSTANQDSPYMQNHIPVLGIDVWEHAYYLDYFSDRATYLAKWWQAVNWDEVEKRLG